MESTNSITSGCLWPNFQIARADGSSVTVRGSSLADALSRYYEENAASAAVVAVSRIDDSQRLPDTAFVFGISVREVEDLSPELAAILIEKDLAPSVSVDADDGA